MKLKGEDVEKEVTGSLLEKEANMVEIDMHGLAAQQSTDLLIL